MNAASLPARFAALQREFGQELIAIADWWAKYSVDHEQGGFYGGIDSTNQPIKGACKGIILNARILWFFSEVAQEVDNPVYRNCATRAYDYIVAHFFDNEQGGVYWELDAAAAPANTKKQVYAQAFVIYALCAYYQLTGDTQALVRALECFKLVERYAIDRKHQGYLEAFTRHWDILEDLRISDNDSNYPKSQNTHRHILEAYTALYQANPSSEIKAALKYNILMFDKYVIDRNTHHLRMYMDLEWKDFSPGYAYGHDIEASWLIAKALLSLGDDAYRGALTPTLIKIAQVVVDEAIGAEGQVIESYNFSTRKINPDTVWWVQAEALVGFLYAYASSREEQFYLAAENVWRFIKTYQIDQKRGEWYWLSSLQKPSLDANYKVGFWKCPYHSGRAMMESMRYLNTVSK